MLAPRYNAHDANTHHRGRQERISMFERTRKMFTKAAKSFVILHRLDYKDAFSCKCQVRPGLPQHCMYFDDKYW